ncbi:SRPBCC family protein [Methylomonas fluvii]|uniref:SRPBCC family protein n=1 Tax=Methylomonas fluvii TaxID=1854564 RepID=A0ABR9D8Y4_9GAMM|nr:SRPBCC family protein [Methylomonas fluvii]MBD9359567.1 SRPBCC family protein [Methylomonas fluvii]
MKAATPLRLALASNATFSLSSALIMLFQPALVGEWLGVDDQFILQLIGIGLVAFAAELFYQATRQRANTWRALLASAADFSWVVGSVVLLLTLPQLFSPLGSRIVIGVAGMVFIFGGWQLWAAGRAHRISEIGKYRHCIIVETNAPAEKLWRVIGDIGDIKTYMPSLKHSVVMDGKQPSLGVVRFCEDHAGKQWSEECTEFNPGRSFTVRFRSEAPNFPFPAKAMLGGWEVSPSNAGSQVMVWWELIPKSRLLVPIILPILAFQVDRDFPKIIQRMTAVALEQDGEVQINRNVGVFTRLLPFIC